MTGRELLDELEAQETRLVFDRFDEDTAWAHHSKQHQQDAA